jgi:hypothetical protein
MVKFRDLELFVNPLKEQIESNFLRASKRVNEIRVKDDIYVQYEEQDAIFEMAKEIDKEHMEATEGPDAATTCGCCSKPANKMKNCQFCGLVNCSQCLFKTRPYPKDNPTKERRGQICLPCNKKFLYRDVKHELTIKLEVRDGAAIA